mgnify:CR=1 FL=1
MDSQKNIELEVLKEFISNAKSSSGFKTDYTYIKQLEYDAKYGEGESIELLNRNFYEILSEEKLEKQEIINLAKKVSSREFKWLVVNDIADLDWNDIIADEFGYVILSNGDRFDIDSDFFKNDRDDFNLKRDKRLRTFPTNGKEYLR